MALNSFIQKQKYPDVKVRYREFTQGIRPETSSSSLLNENRIASPKRKSINSSTRKTSPPLKEPPSILFDKKKMAEALKAHQIGINIRKQREKEEKAAAKILAKEKKETEKQELKDAKILAKSEKAKTVKKSEKAKTVKKSEKEITLEEI